MSRKTVTEPLQRRRVQSRDKQTHRFIDNLLSVPSEARIVHSVEMQTRGERKRRQCVRYCNVAQRHASVPLLTQVRLGVFV